MASGFMECFLHYDEEDELLPDKLTGCRHSLKLLVDDSCMARTNAERKDVSNAAYHY